MSDDIVARLLICAKYDPDQKDAADEITRLRAELAATRAALQYARNLIGPDEIIDAALKGNE
jgi:hypothetical protein